MRVCSHISVWASWAVEASLSLQQSAAAEGGGRWRCGRLNKQVSDVKLKSETASDSLTQTDRQEAVCVEGGAAGRQQAHIYLSVKKICGQLKNVSGWRSGLTAMINSHCAAPCCFQPCLWQQNHMFWTSPAMFRTASFWWDFRTFPATEPGALNQTWCFSNINLNSNPNLNPNPTRP